jgi:hypothetical protein
MNRRDLFTRIIGAFGVLLFWRKPVRMEDLTLVKVWGGWLTDDDYWYIANDYVYGRVEFPVAVHDMATGARYIETADLFDLPKGIGARDGHADD